MADAAGSEAAVGIETAAPTAPSGVPPLRWIDTHCHLAEDPARRSEERADALAAGVTRLITVGCDEPSSQACLAAAREDRLDGLGVWATAGVHPHDATTVVDPATGAIDLGAIEAMLADPKVVAVGECGLDYHYDHSPRAQQREVFAGQIALAHRHGLALVVHSREAWDDTFALLDAHGVPERTVFHCFTGGPDQARAALERNIRLSFSGIVTFPSATDLRAAARLCPLDMLLIETDSPYLAPVPHRGRRNRPALVAVVGEAVASTRDEPVDEVAAAVWGNARTLYLLP